MHTQHPGCTTGGPATSGASGGAGATGRATSGVGGGAGADGSGLGGEEPWSQPAVAAAHQILINFAGGEDLKQKPKLFC